VQHADGDVRERRIGQFPLSETEPRQLYMHMRACGVVGGDACVKWSPPSSRVRRRPRSCPVRPWSASCRRAGPCYARREEPGREGKKVKVVPVWLADAPASNKEGEHQRVRAEG
jgi:hypothetical protein